MELNSALLETGTSSLVCQELMAAKPPPRLSNRAYQRRVVWRSGGVLQHSHPVSGEVLQVRTWSEYASPQYDSFYTFRLPQVALCYFEAEEQQHLCILQPGSLLTYAADGEVNTIPLPAQYSQMFPMQQGLLLAVSLPGQSQSSGLCVWVLLDSFLAGCREQTRLLPVSCSSPQKICSLCRLSSRAFWGHLALKCPVGGTGRM